jgi:hypothetical protein
VLRARGKPRGRASASVRASGHPARSNGCSWQASCDPNRVGAPLRPRGGGGASTSQGRPHTIFRRALERENLFVAEATAKELPRISLGDALKLTLLIAREEPHRLPRVAARWLLRYLEERETATIEEAAMAASCLTALGGAGHDVAATTLLTMAERATSGTRARGVA